MNGIQVVWSMVQAYWFPLLLILFGFAILVRALLMPRAFTPAWIVPDQWKRDYVEQYNTGAIRDLLKDAFTDGDELKEFCQDRTAFRPVIRRVSARPSLTDLVSAVIDYCRSRILFDQLLEDVRKFNPRQYARYQDRLYMVGATGADAVPLSWRDIPTVSRLPRYGVMGVGGVLVATGLVWIMLTSAVLAPPATLIGLSYMVEDWNPQHLDLRTASSSGIPVSKGEALQFFDLWLAVPEDAPGYTVKAEVYAGDELIGTTLPIALIGDQAYPGTAQISEVLVEKYNYDTVPTAWRVQPGWEELSIVLVTERGNKAIASTETAIRLAPGGNSRFFNPPLLSFASIVYTINNGPPLVLDLRSAEETGFGATLSDTLTVLDIWYSSTADSDQTVAVEGFLSLSEFDPTTDRSTGPYVIQDGIHRLPDVSEFIWEVPSDRERLVLWLLRRGTGRSTVMDELVIPLGGPGGAGLTTPTRQQPLTSLIGLRYVVSTSSWNPRMVDLRTASISGISVEPGQPLEFLDLWAWASPGAPGDGVQAEIYVGDQHIGSTSGKDLVTGAIPLGDVTVSDGFQHDDYADAWDVREDWNEIAIILVTYESGEVIGRNRMTIRLDPKGTAWMQDPPNLRFASIVYSINDGTPMVLDLRNLDEVGLPVKPGDTLALREIWYSSNADSDDRQVRAEGFLNSVGDDWERHKYTTPSEIQAGIGSLPDVSLLRWEVPEGEDALILSLWRMGSTDPDVVMDGLSFPLGAQDSPGLVPVSEAVLWPFDQTTFLDFEREADLENWNGDLRLTSDQAFSGFRSLQVTVTDTPALHVVAERDQSIKAEGLIVHYYLPSAPGMSIEELEICLVEPGFYCKQPDRTPDQWHTSVIDFSEWRGVDPPLSSQWIEKLAVQSRIVALEATEPVSYTFYLDAIQIFDREKP